MPYFTYIQTKKSMESIIIHTKSLFYKLIFFLGTLQLFFSCNSNEQGIKFENNNEKCYLNGLPQKSSTSFFPDKFLKLNNLHEFADEYSKINFLVGEPILYNHFLGIEIYRIIFFDSYQDPVIYKIEFTNNYSHISITNIKKPTPNFPKHILSHNESFQYINRRYNLSFKDQKEIRNLLDSGLFWSSEPFQKIGDISLDGNVAIIEGHKSIGYQALIIYDPFVPFFDLPPKSELEKKKKLCYAKLLKFVTSK